MQALMSFCMISAVGRKIITGGLSGLFILHSG
jgi:hypothetical protein